MADCVTFDAVLALSQTEGADKAWETIRQYPYADNAGRAFYASRADYERAVSGRQSVDRRLLFDEICLRLPGLHLTKG